MQVSASSMRTCPCMYLIAHIHRMPNTIVAHVHYAGKSVIVKILNLSLMLVESYVTTRQIQEGVDAAHVSILQYTSVSRIASVLCIACVLCGVISVVCPCMHGWRPCLCLCTLNDLMNLVELFSILVCCFLCHHSPLAFAMRLPITLSSRNVLLLAENSTEPPAAAAGEP